MEVNLDYSDLLSALNGEHVKYLIVGAHALAFHGRPRFTKDLDVWVEPTPENAARVYRALAAFGAPLHDLSQSELAGEDLVFQIGIPPIRIDIMTSISGVSFQDAWAKKENSLYGHVPVWILSRDLLVANKRGTGRLQDLADLETLENEQP
ncbi:MAG: hypothetical protein GIW99_00545 [Candidatus Eremiobacteraeota bacterium]|nr:hypothetical protein [Candidatus Eremiobacteraeota bacterium]MBC5826174.1 hypothetical protein [Candidatus Eremiobacteraeota bacterium]